MEYIALEIFDIEGTGSQFATLDEGASISITDTSEIFASGDVWSFSFTLNVFANAHIFGTTGDIHGSRLHEQIDRRRARLWVEGLPIYLGYLKLGDEVEVKANGDVSVSLESGHKTFDDMIEGMSAQDVSVGDVVIGVALNRKRILSASVSGGVAITGLPLEGSSKFVAGVDNIVIGWGGSMSNSTHCARWPKMVISKGYLQQYHGPDDLDRGGEYDYTNIQYPYDGTPEHSFCNINVCYQKMVVNTDSSGNTEEKKVRGYTLRTGYGGDTLLGGDGQTRFNNSPNFYLLHWLKRLFIDKGIHIEENQMLMVEDLKRVFLANLGCFYEEKDTDLDRIEEYRYYDDSDPDWIKYRLFKFPSDFVLESTRFLTDDATPFEVRLDLVELRPYPSTEGYTRIYTAQQSVVDINAQYSQVPEPKGYYAYATGENYPKVDASEIIKSVEAAFGVRFLFDKDYTNVRIILLRNIFQNKEVQNIECETIEEEKTENKIRGFVLSYGGSDDDTNYNYDDWSRLDTSKSYNEIRERCVTSFNKTCYLTPNNGNSYRIKVDESEALLFPVLMEVGGYCDAKDGNCDGEDDTIETVTIPAKPLIMNDVDGAYAVLFSGDMKAPGETEPIASEIPVTTIDDTRIVGITRRTSLNPEVIQELTYWRNVLANWESIDAPYQYKVAVKAAAESKIQYIEYLQLTDYVTEEYDVHIKGEVFAKEGFRLNLQDNYSFEGNDGTPFDKAELGLCFGIMRGSGADASILYSYDAQDQEGNFSWESSSGNKAFDHPDTCDNWGYEWDYNGTGEGIGSREGRFSLKLRAEKPNQTITNPNLQRRGLMDQFYKEYSYWIRNARIVTKKVNMTLAQLLSIDKTKRIRIGDVTGYVRKIQYTVSNKTGLGPVTLEIMYI